MKNTNVYVANRKDGSRSTRTFGISSLLAATPFPALRVGHLGTLKKTHKEHSFQKGSKIRNLSCSTFVMHKSGEISAFSHLHQVFGLKKVISVGRLKHVERES